MGFSWDDVLLQGTDTIEEPCVQIDTEGLIASVNPAFIQITGYSQSDLQNGLTFIDLVAPFDQIRAETDRKRTTAGENLGPIDYTFKRRNGGYFQARILYNLIKDPQKGTVICGSIMEQSQNNWIEKAYQMQMEAMAAAMDGIAIVTNSEQFVYVNKAFVQMNGYSGPSEMIGLSWRILFSKDEIDRITKVFIDHLEECREWRGRVEGLRKNGEKYTQEISFTALDQGGFAIIARDIMRQKLIEESLIESEEKFRSISSRARDAIVMLNHKGQVTFWNESAEKIFGYSESEISGQELHKLLADPKYSKEYETGFMRFTETGHGNVVNKILHLDAIKKDGSSIPVELSVAAVNRKNKWNAIGIIRDVSNRKKMELELLKASKLESLGILAGGIAHDFNNMLTGIITNIYLAKLLSKSDSRIVKILTDTESVIIRAKDLTHQLLTFSQGGLPVKSVMSITELIRNTAHYSLNDSEISCKMSFEDELYKVKIDSAQIGQVINNILINARHSMGNHGKISIDISNVSIDESDRMNIPPGHYLQVVIKDQGQGISPDIIEKIFDPYFTTKKDGNGLGLAIAYSIIKKHDGYIWVDSVKDNGATFTLLLPAILNEKEINNTILS